MNLVQLKSDLLKDKSTVLTGDINLLDTRFENFEHPSVDGDNKQNVCRSIFR